MTCKNLSLAAVGFCALTWTLGCGGQPEYPGEQRFPVSGTVSYQGNPVDGGMMSLIPDGAELNPSGGVITNGEFSVPEAKGPNKGQYRVAVYWHKPTGKKVDDPDTGEQIDETQQVIPPQYNEATELTFMVSGDAAKDKIELKLE